MRHLFHKLLLFLLLLGVGHTLAQHVREHACAVYSFGREMTDVNALTSRLLTSATSSLPGLLDELDVPLDVPGECPLTQGMSDEENRRRFIFLLPLVPPPSSFAILAT